MKEERKKWKADISVEGKQKQRKALETSVKWKYYIFCLVVYIRSSTFSVLWRNGNKSPQVK